MGENSKIQWTHHTFNPWRGCAKVHTGCANCYAEALSKRNPGTLGTWGPNGSRVLASPAMWREPLKWNRDAEAAGERRRVFCASLADVFEDWSGPVLLAGKEPVYAGKDLRASSGERATLDDVRARLFALIDATPWLDWLLLTKRPENVAKMWPAFSIMPPTQRVAHWLATGNENVPKHADARPHRANVWLGTSISNQSTADVAIPKLLECRDLAPVLFLSAEPLVGPVQLDVLDTGAFESTDCLAGERSYAGRGGRAGHSTRCASVDWVIVGGESGPGARPFDVGWARALVKQCRGADVAVFVKQLGARPEIHETTTAAAKLFPNGLPPGAVCEGTYEEHRTNFLQDKKGGDPREWPEDLRNAREFPAAVTV